MTPQNRREFLATVAAGFAAARGVLAAQSSASGVPTRPFGRSGERLPILGLGGFDLGVPKDEAEAVAIMHEAIGEGLTFFDNAWEYHGGRSEERMGRALQGGRRDKVFLMTKVCGRTYEDARQNLDDSLRRLQTDRIDLWQFHGIKWDDDPDLIFDPARGALRAALEARKAGKVRFIGFTGHKDPAHHLKMLARTEGGKPFEWDAVQMPINILDAHYHSFQKEVLPVCVKRNIAPLAMKALCSQNGRLVREFGFRKEDCRRFVLSLPVCSNICGITTREQLREDLAIARAFKPMTPEELATLLDRAKGPGADGHVEAYKVGDYGCNIHHQPRR